MTRQYQIQKITGKPDWNKIEKAPIDQKLWLPCEQISAYAQLAYDDSRLYVRSRSSKNVSVLFGKCVVTKSSMMDFWFSIDTLSRSSSSSTEMRA